MGFNYREAVLRELARHGVIPCEDTPPDLIRDYINELYLIEIRSLRAKMKAGQIRKKDYAGRVGDLRDQYPILSLRLDLWTEEEARSQASQVDCP